MISINNMLRQNLVRSATILLSCILSALLTVFVRYNLTWQANLLQKNDFKGFFFLSIISLLAYILGTFLNYFGTYYLLSKNIQQYSHSIRAELLKRYSSDLVVSKAKNDMVNNIEIIENRYFILLVALFDNFCLLIFSILAILSLHWIIVITTLALAIILLKLPDIFKRVLEETSFSTSNQTKNYIESIANWVNGLDILRRFNKYDVYTRKLSIASKLYTDACIKNIRVGKSASLVVIVGNVVAQLMILALTGILIINSVVPFGAIFSIGTLIGYTFSYVVILANGLIQMKSGGAVVKQLNSQLNQGPVKVNKVSDYQVEKYIIKDVSIKFDNGTKILYPNIDIDYGEKILLTGQSGTGKSSLFKVVLGQLQTATGEIEVIDKNGKTYPLESANIGYVPQDPILLPASIIDNITMFSSNLRAQALEIIEQVKLKKDINKFRDGVDSLINAAGSNLSGGQKQKIILARTLLYKKPLILIDEGTSAIDARSSEEILRVVTNIDATVIVIGHNLSSSMKKLFDKEITLQPIDPDLK